jgi:hypothetical protein
MLPWPSLNRIIDLAETLNACARGIYETKKRLLELDDEETVKRSEMARTSLVYSVRATHRWRLHFRNCPNVDVVIYSAS